MRQVLGPGALGIISFTFIVSSYYLLVAQMVKNLPAMEQTCIQSLGQKDLLEKEMAIHSNSLAWKIPWTEEPGRIKSMGSQRVRHHMTERLTHKIFLGYFIENVTHKKNRLIESGQ